MQISFGSPDQYGRFDVTIPGIITIKGCRHMVSDRYNFIAFPQYLKRDKEGKVVNSSKTGKPLYVADFALDKAFEKRVLDEYLAANGATPQSNEEQDEIPF